MVQRLDDQQQPAPARGDAVRVSMASEHLLFNLPERIDLAATETLVIAAGAVVESGQTVMIDLDPLTDSDELAARRPAADTPAPHSGEDCGTVAAIAPGYVRVAVRDGFWTIDLNGGRLLRSQTAIRTHFLGRRDWIRIRALWAGPRTLTALRDDGTYLSTRAAWTIDPVRTAV